jgi:hypothetical protein
MDLILCFVYFSLLYIPETKTFSYLQNHCTIHLPSILIISTSEDGGSAFLQNTGKSLPLLQGSKTGKISPNRGKVLMKGNVPAKTQP